MVERLAGKMPGRALALCFFFLLGCFPSVANAALDQWTAVGPIGQGANTLAIDGTNPSIIYAGRDNGVFKSTDSGSSWGAINSGLFFTVFGVPRVLSVAVDPSSPALYAGAAAPIGGMFKSTNGGASWNRIVNGLSLFTGPPAVLSIAIDRSNPSTLYVGTAHNGAFKSTDGGATWRAIAGALNDVQGFFMPPDVPALVIDPSNPSTLYAGTGESFGVGGRGIFKSIDAGANWLQINNGLPSRTRVLSLLIDGSSPSTLYAGTSGHGVFKSTDGGTSWRAINIGLTNFTVQALVMDPSNPSTLYAATNGQGVFRSSDSGANWSALNNGLTNLTALSLAIDPTSPSNLYAGGGGGVFKLVAGATDPPFTSDRDGDGLPLTAQVVEPPFSPEFRKYEGVAHKLTAFPAFTRSYRAIVRPLSQEKWLQLNDPSLGGLNMVTATTRMARYSSGQLIVFSGCKPHFCPNAEVAVAFNPVTGNTWALVRLEDNTSRWLGPENAEIRKILLSLLSEPPDTEPPSASPLLPLPVSARTQSDNRPPDWLADTGCVPTTYSMMIEYAAQQASIEKLDLPALIGSLHEYYLAHGVLDTKRSEPNFQTNVINPGNTAAFVREMAIKLNAGACMKTRDSNAVVTARFDPTNTDKWPFPTFMIELQRNLSEGRPTGIAVHILGRRKTSGSLTYLAGHEMLVVGLDAKTESIYVNDTWSSVPSVWTRVELHAWDKYFSYSWNSAKKAIVGLKSNWDVAFIRSGDMTIGGVQFTEVMAVLADPVGLGIDLNTGNGFVTTRLEFTPCDAAKEETTAPPAFTQLNPQWFGMWRPQNGDSTLIISSSKMVSTFLREADSSEKARLVTVEYRWSNSDVSEESFGLSKERTSPAAIRKRYEEAVTQFEKDPTDFGISDPQSSRAAIAAISPGVYKVMWSYAGGDCGYSEYILDGGRMLEFSECKYWFGVTLYNRIE